MKNVPPAFLLLALVGCGVPRPLAEEPVSGSCVETPWAAMDATDVPPEVMLECESDVDCGSRATAACCQTFHVAVNERFGVCIAEQNDDAHCVANCAISTTPWTAPEAECVAGRCQLVPADGNPRTIVVQPFSPPPASS